jgi:hypothetical protein
MSDELAMAWLQQSAKQGNHKDSPEYKALSPEGQQMADDFLGAFYTAKSPGEFGKLFFGNEEGEQEA